MSDTVKLVIELPKDRYTVILRIADIQMVRRMPTLEQVVANGIPLDDVKTEIDKAQEPYQTSTAYDEGVRFGLMLAYQIVDRYKAESEDVVVTNKNLCDSCTTKNCIFQSGIVRNHCDFYKAESEDT